MADTLWRQRPAAFAEAGNPTGLYTTPRDMAILGQLVRDDFFFQAEDGIRDWSVTGVQTCALPICYLAEHYARTAPGIAARVHVCYHGLDLARLPYRPEGRPPRRIVAVGRLAKDKGFARSEERRVGEEGRGRGSPERK